VSYGASSLLRDRASKKLPPAFEQEQHVDPVAAAARIREASKRIPKSIEAEFN
jgi:hypothetical protein